MGLLSNLGGIIKETGRGMAVGAVSDLFGISSGSVQYPEYEYDANGHIKGINSKYAAQIANAYGSTEKGLDGVDGGFGSLGNSSSSLRLKNVRKAAVEDAAKYDKEWSSSQKIEHKDEKRIHNQDDALSDIFYLKLPDWNYANFINERAIWQKGLSSAFDEPAWFYFKIFFDFDTNHGLFGGLLNSEQFTQATNSAAKYLHTNNLYHRHAKPTDRIISLYKFTSTLSYICDNAPWYFKEIKNLQSVYDPDVDNFSREKYIEIGLNHEAIDMRLTTLMSLYKFACFDNMLNKEIIPENLRKFNMSIILFQAPLRYLHTSFTSNKKIEFMGVDVGAAVNEVTSLFGKKKSTKAGTNYKSMNVNNGDSQNFGDLMSMKIYSFYGCEFDMNSFGNIIPGQMSNENPFQLGNSSLRINYTTVREHTMNEFYGMMFGSDGFYFNQYNNFQVEANGKKIDGYVNRNKDTWQKQQERYQALKDNLDDLTQGGTILGLIDSPKTYKKAIDATEAVMNGLFDSKGLLSGLAANFALGLLGSSASSDAPLGNIYGDFGVGSAYYKDKLEMLKNGVHDRTMAPYYYDPVSGARVDLHKNQRYSAYNYKNDKDTISSFSLTDWTNNAVSNAGSSVNNWMRKILNGSGTNTTAPYVSNPYNSKTAQEMDNKKYGEHKTDILVDGSPSNQRHQYTQPPYVYDVMSYMKK